MLRCKRNICSVNSGMSPRRLGLSTSQCQSSGNKQAVMEMCLTIMQHLGSHSRYCWRKGFLEALLPLLDTQRSSSPRETQSRSSKGFEGTPHCRISACHLGLHLFWNWLRPEYFSTRVASCASSSAPERLSIFLTPQIPFHGTRLLGFLEMATQHLSHPTHQIRMCWPLIPYFSLALFKLKKVRHKRGYLGST